MVDPDGRYTLAVSYRGQGTTFSLRYPAEILSNQQAKVLTRPIFGWRDSQHTKRYYQIFILRSNLIYSMNMFDVHTHVHFAAFEKDYQEVIDRALKKNIKIVNVGTQKDTSKRAVELAYEYPKDVYAVIGLHPIHTSKSFHDKSELGGDKSFTSRGEEFDHDYYFNLAKDEKVVAIGECGLDYYHLEKEEDKEKQKKAFISQIRLAQEVRKALMIHTRPKEDEDAYLDVYNILKEEKPSVPIIIHFYVGSKEMAKKFLDLGCYFTFGGVITFAKEYEEVINLIPIERILTETDAPYVSPAPHRGKRNEPAYVIEVAKKLGEIKNLSLGEIEEITEKTANKVFGL